MKMHHNSFSEIDFGDDLEADVTLHGLTFKVSFLDPPSDNTQIDTFGQFLSNLPHYIEIAMARLEKEYDDVVIDAFEAWDELEPDMMQQLFPNRTLGTPISFEQTKSALFLAHVWHHDEGTNMDFKFKNVDMDYLITAAFSNANALDYVSMES